ncbi:MAG: ABC transporter substrate-binding protein [Actinomycetota bacterium]
MHRSVLLAAGLVLAACAGGSDDATSVPTDDAAVDPSDPSGDVPLDADEPTGNPTTDTGDGTGEDAVDADVDDDVGTDSPADELPTEAAPEPLTDPSRGGTLTVLLEAESDTWDIPNANCATSCITVMQQIADPLLAVNDSGELEPFLLEDVEISDDLTTWTLTMRPDVVFHDGTAADGAAVQRHLREYAAGIVQSQAYRTLEGGPAAGEGIELLDDMTVRVTFDEPNAAFGHQLASWSGWLLAPSFWDDESPTALPIATGPFEMIEWSRNEITRLRASTDYWRTSESGAPLPYLDGIDFRPVPDVSARRAIMEAGDADVNVDSFPENLAFWTGDWVSAGNSLARVDPDRDVEYLLLNASRSPFSDREFRRALAACTDREEYLAFRAPGMELASGPFAAGSLGFTDETDFPEFDPDAASAMLDELGRPDDLVIGTTNVPSQQLTAELLVDQWLVNCDLEVAIDVFEQSEYITRALVADYDLLVWRNHGQGYPAMESVWWHSRHTEGLATNFGRIVDDDIDRLLDQLAATVDPVEVDRLGQEITRVFGSEVYNIWLNTGAWAVPVRQGVFGVGTVEMPSGEQIRGAIGGRLWLHEAWLAS